MILRIKYSNDFRQNVLCKQKILHQLCLFETRNYSMLSPWLTFFLLNAVVLHAFQKSKVLCRLDDDVTALSIKSGLETMSIRLITLGTT